MKSGVGSEASLRVLTGSNKVVHLCVKEQSLDFCALYFLLSVCGFGKYLLQLICNVSNFLQNTVKAAFDLDCRIKPLLNCVLFRNINKSRQLRNFRKKFKKPHQSIFLPLIKW